MSSTPSAVAIYARISSDTEGVGAGVTRQVEDCRKLAERLGWAVADVYVDNDISAYSRKRRPEYERMLADLADGVVDGVLVYHVDRLTRQLKELERFVEVVDDAKVKHVRFVSSDVDMTTEDGLMLLRFMAIIANRESADKSRRVRRKMEQVAAEGRPHGGRVRPFGYAEDKITVLEHEADTYRALVARFLAGESTRSLATWLNDQEVPTVTGRPWITTTLKGMLTNPRYAGLRAHRGVVVGPAVWDAIISEEDHRRVLAKYAEKKTSGRRTPQRYLLSGVLRCGKCGNRLYSSLRQRKYGSTRRYVCSSGPDHGGCGRLTIVADPLERMIADYVLHRLDTPELSDALARRATADARTQELTAELDKAQTRLDDLSLGYGQGDIDMRAWMIAKKPIEHRLETLKRQLGQITRTSALTGLVGNGEELGRAWNDLNLSRQHAIVEALIDHIVIKPGGQGPRQLDPARVGVVWRH